MKRSEAVKLIKEELKHQISLEDADRVLSKLEEAGMSPPERVIHKEPVIDEDTYEVRGHYITYDTEWEEE